MTQQRIPVYDLVAPGVSLFLIFSGVLLLGRNEPVGVFFKKRFLRILPPDFRHPLLNDSKQMTEKERDGLRPIIEAEAVAWAVEAVQADAIDQLNILWASVTGMQRAVLRLDPAPDFLLVDGNKFRPFGRYGFKDFRTVVHGDATFASIAAASVLAKTYRDEFMRKIACDYPEYGWDRNMGYPTPEHIDAIRRLGYTPWHRKSFHVKELEPTLF